MKNEVKCINFDWLEVFCIEPADLCANYFKKLGWDARQREYVQPPSQVRVTPFLCADRRQRPVPANHPRVVRQFFQPLQRRLQFCHATTRKVGTPHRAREKRIPCHQQVVLFKIEAPPARRMSGSVENFRRQAATRERVAILFVGHQRRGTRG